MSTVPTLNDAPWFLRARLKTRQLLLVVALGEEGTLHRAAEVLNMTQPAASKLLKDLEDALGVVLFERLPRGMRPTGYGESLLRHARLALSNLNQAHDEIAAMKAGLMGRVCVGAIATPALTVMPEAISAVKETHPGLHISLEVDNSPALLEGLRRGRFDLVIARVGHDDDPREWLYQRLCDEPVVAVVRQGHAWLPRQDLDWRQTADAGWILPPVGGVLRSRFDEMFQQAGVLPPSDIVESGSLTFIIRLLQQTDRLSVMATDLAQYLASHGMLAPLPMALPCDMDAYGIITRRGLLPSPGAQAMLDALARIGASAPGAEAAR